MKCAIKEDRKLNKKFPLVRFCIFYDTFAMFSCFNTNKDFIFGYSTSGMVKSNRKNAKINMEMKKQYGFSQNW